MRRPKRKVQGTYITEEAKEILEKQAKKEGIKTTTLASEILEKEAKILMKKEKKNENLSRQSKDSEG